MLGAGRSPLKLLFLRFQMCKYHYVEINCLSSLVYNKGYKPIYDFLYFFWFQNRFLKVKITFKLCCRVTKLFTDLSFKTHDKVFKKINHDNILHQVSVGNEDRSLSSVQCSVWGSVGLAFHLWPSNCYYTITQSSHAGLFVGV